MNGEMDVFEAMRDPWYEPIDPFSGMTPSAIAGGPAKHFSFEAYAPEPDIWAPVRQPLDYLWGKGEELVEHTLEEAPKMLWERGLQEIGLLPKQRVVSEGAGVTVIHSQAPQAGGAPAQPTQRVIPGQVPFFMPAGGPQDVGTSTMILIGAGILVLIILLR